MRFRQVKSHLRMLPLTLLHSSDDLSHQNWAFFHFFGIFHLAYPFALCFLFYFYYSKSSSRFLSPLPKSQTQVDGSTIGRWLIYGMCESVLH